MSFIFGTLMGLLSTVILVAAQLAPTYGASGAHPLTTLMGPLVAGCALLCLSICCVLWAWRDPAVAAGVKRLMYLNVLMFLAGTPFTVVTGVLLAHYSAMGLWPIVNLGGLIGGVIWCRTLPLGYQVLRP